jgi:hypothetical protein
MAPVALQMKLAASRTSVRSTQKVSGPTRLHRMAVQQRNARHVAMRSTKVEELETSSKAGALLLDTCAIMVQHECCA